MVLLTVALLVAMTPLPTRAANGPRWTKGLDINFYATPDVAYADLKLGGIDFMQWALTYEQLQDAIADPSIQIAPIDENGMWEIDINNNYTIRDYAGIRSPTNDLNFRKALTCMVDKNWILNDVVKDMGARIDVPIAAPQISGWADPSVIGANFPYEFNMTKAAEYLTAGGFVDTDDDDILNYPADWPGRPGQPNMDPLKAKIRNDHAPMFQAGRALVDNLRSLGVPVDEQDAPSSVLFPIVMNGICNYHFYTGGYSVGRYPTYWLTMFHGDYWPTQNYVTGVNADGLPNYPDFDNDIHNLYYAANMLAAVAACKQGTIDFMNHCISVPVWTSKSYWGYRKALVGIVDMYGYGLENTYTFLNCYKADDPATPYNESLETLKFGTVNAPLALNQLYSQWYFDYAVLDRIFPAGQMVEPYNLAVDNPGICQDWEVSTWTDTTVDPPVEKTKVTYWIRKGVKIVAPVTGAPVRDFTAHDLEFTTWYGYAFPDGWNFADWQDVEKTKIIDDYEIEFYFSSKSMWFYNAPTNQLFPRNEWLATLCGPASASFVSNGTDFPASTKYEFTTTDKVVEITSVTRGATPLTEGVDYEILAAGSPTFMRNIIHFLVNQPAGTITVNYYRSTVDPHGFFIGDLPWTSTWYGTGGPYYPINILTGVGGVASLGANTNYWLETPPLGEIDWRWTWTGSTKPRSGYYQVWIYDMVKVTAAYCSRGDGAPQANWFPGADIDPIDLCHVGPYDVILVYAAMGGLVNIAVTSVTVSKTVVGQGYCMNITVIVKNELDLDLPLPSSITAYANTTPIETKSVTLAQLSSTSITFTWNTAGFAMGNYTIWAYATPVPGEIQTADNTLANGSILVTIPGDVDGDLEDGHYDVDLFDAVRLLACYGAKEGDSNFDPNCDIDSDGQVFLFDAVILLSRYGQKYP